MKTFRAFGGLLPGVAAVLASLVLGGCQTPLPGKAATLTKSSAASPSDPGDSRNAVQPASYKTACQFG